MLSKKSIPVNATAGSNVVVASAGNAWIYIHDIIGDLSATGTVVIKGGSEVLGEFHLDEGQGLTLGGGDEVRFECKPGDDFILDITGGDFNGSCVYSFRY